MKILIYSLFFIYQSLILGVSLNKKGIFIISAPRTTSTLLMRIFANSKEISENYLLEPYTQVYYLENHINGAGFNLQKDWPQTKEQAWNKILSAFSKDFFVIKDLAYQIEPYLTDEQLLEIDKYAHIIFLVRYPKATIASGIYAYEQDNIKDGFSSEEAGFIHMKIFFDRCKKLSINTYLIEAEKYLANPSLVLPNYFSLFGLKFDEDTLVLKKVHKEELNKNPAYCVWGDLWFKNAFATDVIKPINLSYEPSKTYQNVSLDKINQFLPNHYEAYLYIKENALDLSSNE